MSKYPSDRDSDSRRPYPVVALTVDQVCRRLQISRPSVIALITSKRLFAIKVGRSWRISQQSLDRLLTPPKDGEL